MRCGSSIASGLQKYTYLCSLLFNYFEVTIAKIESISNKHQKQAIKSHLLKFATIIGMGRVMHKTPQMAHREPTSFPPAVVGATSP